jgi:hypothetical protein
MEFCIFDNTWLEYIGRRRIEQECVGEGQFVSRYEKQIVHELGKCKDSDVLDKVKWNYTSPGWSWCRSCDLMEAGWKARLDRLELPETGSRGEPLTTRTRPP